MLTCIHKGRWECISQYALNHCLADAHLMGVLLSVCSWRKISLDCVFTLLGWRGEMVHRQEKDEACCTKFVRSSKCIVTVICIYPLPSPDLFNSIALTISFPKCKGKNVL